MTISNQTIRDEAADFVARRHDPDWSAQDEEQFSAWIEQSLAHKAAYWRLSHAWSEADRLAALGPNLIQIRRPWWRRWPGFALAASILVAVGLSLSLLTQVTTRAPVQTEAHSTVRGERSIASLADGSRIELNTATQLRASVTDERREVWLDAGEAYFEVAEDRNRPFVVHAGNHRITVLGTKFSVRRAGADVRIAVAEGRVRIEANAESGESANAASHTLTPGATATVRGPETLVTAGSAERVLNALRWREGMLSFDHITLGEAAEEFNRYNQRRIVITDPQTAATRIGGTFRADNIDGFVRLLEDIYGLRIERRADEVRIGGGV